MSLLVLTDEAMALHDPGQGHPERPDRLLHLQAALAREPLPGMRLAHPRAAEVHELARVHDRAHVDAVLALDGRWASLDADTHVSPASVQAALLAAGAAIEAVEAVLDGDADEALALVRPPGHHAEHDRAMGFCLFNNLAVAIEHARATRGLERALVVDWDVHHGNGTAHTYDERADTLVFDTHQWPMFPGTGARTDRGSGAGEGLTLNVPLPAGAGDAELLRAFTEELVPAARAFRPDCVFLAAGFDAHELDPLGGLRVTDAGYAALARVVRDLAHELCDGRLVATLEGGYALEGLEGGLRATFAG